MDPSAHPQDYPDKQRCPTERRSSDQRLLPPQRGCRERAPGPAEERADADHTPEAPHEAAHEQERGEQRQHSEGEPRDADERHPAFDRFDVPAGFVELAERLLDRPVDL